MLSSRPVLSGKIGYSSEEISSEEGWEGGIVCS